MSDTTTEAAATKSKTEYTKVTLTDGRETQFAGKRKLNKETLIDESKIVVDGDVMQIQAGAISVRMDFRNGDTRTYPIPLSLLAKFTGHGGEQKFGDELATTADKPLSEDDMVLAVDALYSEIEKGSWGKGRAAGGGGVSGAGIVLQAILEATNNRNTASGKTLITMDVVKAYIDKKLNAEQAKPEAERMSRRQLYDSFRVAGTDTGVIIKRLEEAKLAKTAKVDADAELDSIGA